MGADSVNIRPLFLKENRMTGKKYFYACGQSARARGLTKDQGMIVYAIEAGLPYARIAFDAGYRGLSL
jgi:hypothetical protein